MGRTIAAGAVESNASLRNASKHLFRHLHDVAALRKNPIARPYFQAAQAQGPERSTDRALLRRFHELIARVAEHCRDQDLASGKDERALRQHAIVTLNALGGEPIEDAARRLGISLRQCYRERADIFLRIGSELAVEDGSRPVPAIPAIDEFALALDGVMRRAALGQTRRALEDCATLAAAPSLVHRLAALRAKATILADFGERAAAQDVLRDAERIWAEPRDLNDAPALAHASMAMLRWQLAHQRADGQTVVQSARDAVAILRTQSKASPMVRDLLCEGLFALGTGLCNAGDMQGGYDHLADAEAELTEDCSVSFTVKSRIHVVVWKLRCALLTSARAWRPACERTQGLTHAFERAYASGDFASATAALDAMTQQHVTAGNDTQAMHAATLALRIAEQQSSARVLSQLAIRLALKLLPTSYAREATALASRVNVEACDAYHRQLVAHFQSERALAEGRFLDVLDRSVDRTDGAEYAALAVHRSIVRAAAAQAIGRRSAARSMIESAIPAAEQLNAADTLLDTYRVAAKVLGEARFTKRAREIANLFAG